MNRTKQLSITIDIDETYPKTNYACGVCKLKFGTNCVLFGQELIVHSFETMNGREIFYLRCEECLKEFGE